jgi:hypothetical protein
VNLNLFLLKLIPLVNTNNLVDNGRCEGGGELNGQG